MSQLEYLIALISIIIGLGLTDLARSLRDLVRPGRPVRWHWLPLTWTLIIFMIVVQLWWNAFEVLQKDLFADALAFLPYLLTFLVLYLACSFALPDPTWENASPPSSEGRVSSEASPPSTSPLDLEAFYFSPSHRRGFFGTMIALLVLGQVISLVFPLLQEGTPSDSAGTMLNFGVNLVAVALFSGLLATDWWWLHAGGTALTFGVVCFTLAVGMPPIG